jgi:DNA-binding response OmpR family regulator
MRILLVEDEPDLGKAIQKVLTREGYVIDWIEDGDEAWECLESNFVQYDIAILDWMLPGRSGIELCHKAVNISDPPRVLMLTARGELPDRVTGLDTGADDYLPKPFRMQELLARVRSIQRRISPRIVTTILQAGQLLLNCQSLSISLTTAPAPEIALTWKEFQLLEYLISNKNLTVTHQQIIDRLWSDGQLLGDKALVAQVKLLRKKLVELGCTEIIENVYGTGYRLIAHD